MMSGKERREEILQRITNSKTPVSGAALAKSCEVSRQVIVQDIALIRAAGKKKGIDVSQMEGVDFAAFKETQYDILAAELRKHLDMKKIYEILEEGTGGTEA